MKIGSVKLFERVEIGQHPHLLIRYVIVRFPWVGLYVHRLLRSDYDRALHDHPWPFISFLLGSYTEVHDQTIDHTETRVVHPKWSVLLRPAEWRHRLVLDRPVWTIVLVGRRQRRWGFCLPAGWCWWRKYDSGRGICEDRVLWEDGSD